MAELKNTFCWSFSQAKDFAACPRRYYWIRYGSWGGWEDMAPKGVKLAYRLKQMKNRFALAGIAVDLAIKDAVASLKSGREKTFEDALDYASSYLRKAWIEHMEGRWAGNPKRYVCIKEIYHGEFSPDDAEARNLWASSIKEKVETCLMNFFGMVLPKIRPLIAKGELVDLSDPDAVERESFALGGIKIYAMPDTVIVKDDSLSILDWKTGRPRQFYANQMETYGLWAQCRHEVPPDRIDLTLVYLPDGTCQKVEYGPEIARRTFNFIRESVQDISDKLVNGDIARNEPLMMENFAQTDKLEVCAHCNFMELCQRTFALKKE